MNSLKSLRKEGVGKKEIYERAVAEGLDKKKVSRFLAGYPDRNLSEKYNIANKILVGICSIVSLLSISAIIGLLSEFSSGVTAGILVLSLLFQGMIIYSIYKKHFVGYFIFIFLMVRGIFHSYNGYESDFAGAWIGRAICVVLLIYLVVMKNKLFPFQNFFHTRKSDEGIFIYTND